MRVLLRPSASESSSKLPSSILHSESTVAPNTDNEQPDHLTEALGDQKPPAIQAAGTAATSLVASGTTTQHIQDSVSSNAVASTGLKRSISAEAGATESEKKLKPTSPTSWLERKPSAKTLTSKAVEPKMGEFKSSEAERSNHGGHNDNDDARTFVSYAEAAHPSFEEAVNPAEDGSSSQDDSVVVDMENNPAAVETEEPSEFEAALKSRGLEIRQQEGDGNCLFRAVSLQVYGDASSHADIRKRCLDFMAEDEAHFSQFVTDEDFQDYIERKRIDGVHGNNPEIQAISELFNRPVEVYTPENGAQAINIFHEEYKTSDAPIRLSYHDGNHYNAVVDPLCPTAGLGLGLPGLEPGLADRMQMAKAVEESDKTADEAELKKAVEASHNDELQRAMKESYMSVDLMYKKKAMALSDLEATEIELEQAALVSSLESYQQVELGRKQPYLTSARRRQGRTSPPGSARNVNNTQSDLPSGYAGVENVAYASSSVASAQSSSVASAAARGPSPPPAQATIRQDDEYPQTVQELVMNGFELSKVVRAYELIGDNFDDLLAFLMTSTSGR